MDKQAEEEEVPPGIAKVFARMKKALQDVWADTGYCHVCGQHRHPPDCPLFSAEDDKEYDE